MNFWKSARGGGGEGGSFSIQKFVQKDIVTMLTISYKDKRARVEEGKKAKGKKLQTITSPKIQPLEKFMWSYTTYWSTEYF